MRLYTCSYRLTGNDITVCYKGMKLKKECQLSLGDVCWLGWIAVFVVPSGPCMSVKFEGGREEGKTVQASCATHPTQQEYSARST